MIYFIITCSVYNDCKVREMQYCTAIAKAKQLLPKCIRIIVVDNNGKRKTFLDKLGCEVFYTNNNLLPTKNKGVKELKDIYNCIVAYSIQDSDFIVKMTGRYVLENDSEFIEVLKNISNNDCDCIIKYGSYMKPIDFQTNDCITGLIGMKTRYIKSIKTPLGMQPIEHYWAQVTYLMEPKKIIKVKNLGINICPGNNTYFLI